MSRISDPASKSKLDFEAGSVYVWEYNYRSSHSHYYFCARNYFKNNGISLSEPIF